MGLYYGYAKVLFRSFKYSWPLSAETATKASSLSGYDAGFIIAFASISPSAMVK